MTPQKETTKVELNLERHGKMSLRTGSAPNAAPQKKTSGRSTDFPGTLRVRSFRTAPENGIPLDTRIGTESAAQKSNRPFRFFLFSHGGNDAPMHVTLMAQTLADECLGRSDFQNLRPPHSFCIRMQDSLSYFSLFPCHARGGTIPRCRCGSG